MELGKEPGVQGLVQLGRNAIERVAQLESENSYLRAANSDGAALLHKLRDRIAALEAEKAERERQEPVAWQWLTSGHFRKYFPPNDATRKDWRPLYAAPPIPRVEQEPVAWVLFDDIFIAPKDMQDDPPNLECMKPLYAHPLALREPTDDECREIADRFLCEVANAARGVRTGRAMFNAVREVMKMNARKIAAAPELVEALRTARDYVFCELETERQQMKGYERISRIDEIAADLAEIDAALASLSALSWPA